MIGDCGLDWMICSELGMDLTVLVTTPCSLALRCLRVVTLASWNLVKGIVVFNLRIFWKVFIWILAFVTLPVRIVTALQIESSLKLYLRELQVELETIIWEKKELEERLQRTIKERKIIETVFEEIEEEHEKALSRIDMLEAEVQNLTEENMRLNQIYGKALWDYKVRDDKISSWPERIPLPGNYRLSSWGTGYKGGGIVLQDIPIQGDSWDDVHRNKSQEQSPITSSLISQIFSRDLVADEILERQRVVARCRSLFSSTLSLIVGMIVWKAEDPCMPLVVALFTVVGMSLNSVVQFFSTVKNKPASDAVALLSINWFILGTITYPTLPTVAQMLAPQVIKLADKFLLWLGLSS